MSVESDYAAFRAYADVAIKLAVRDAIPGIRSGLLAELRASLPPETRAAEPSPGLPGKDGRGISRIYIQPDGILAVRYTDSTEEYSVGKVVGEKGDPGKDGSPGIGERGADGKDGKDGELSTVPGPKGDPGERGADGIATRAELDELVEQRFGELQVRTFADVYQGVYEPNRTYTRGLLTTWGGSLWLSQSDTKTKPGESPDWKLVVKKGSDGRK